MVFGVFERLRSIVTLLGQSPSVIGVANLGNVRYGETFPQQGRQLSADESHGYIPITGLETDMQ